ncbi:MAG TPA: hypothetical protein VGE07_23185 [Herpetosiphonaceae bacterium]
MHRLTGWFASRALLALTLLGALIIALPDAAAAQAPAPSIRARLLAPEPPTNIQRIRVTGSGFTPGGGVEIEVFSAAGVLWRGGTTADPATIWSCNEWFCGEWPNPSSGQMRLTLPINPCDYETALTIGARDSATGRLSNKAVIAACPW